MKRSSSVGEGEGGAEKGTKTVAGFLSGLHKGLCLGHASGRDLCIVRVTTSHPSSRGAARPRSRTHRYQSRDLRAGLFLDCGYKRVRSNFPRSDALLSSYCPPTTESGTTAQEEVLVTRGLLSSPG